MYPPYLVCPNLARNTHCEARECALLPRASGAFWEGSRKKSRRRPQARAALCAGRFLVEGAGKAEPRSPAGRRNSTERVSEREEGKARGGGFHWHSEGCTVRAGFGPGSKPADHNKPAHVVFVPLQFHSKRANEYETEWHTLLSNPQCESGRGAWSWESCAAQTRSIGAWAGKRRSCDGKYARQSAS